MSATKIQILDAGDRTVEISRPDKVLFPDDGITKADLAGYYARIADTMLPHVKDRPITMHRFPDGLDGESFFQKQAGDYFPEWVRTKKVKKEGGIVEMVMADKAATLVYLADQGAITPHIWLSRIDRPRHPDRLIFDLDPSGDNFDWVRDAARRLREWLRATGLEPFVMTTGSHGLHVTVPLDRSADFDSTRDFAGRLAKLLVSESPNEFTIEQRKAKRGNRVYLDTMRNAYGQTGVAPYAVRARPEAPVATPLDWDEVGRVKPDSYSIHNLFRRLGGKSDPWSDIQKHAQALAPAANRLADMEES